MFTGSSTDHELLGRAGGSRIIAGAGAKKRKVAVTAAPDPDLYQHRTGHSFARSAEFMQGPVIQALVWARVPGNIVFSIGAAGAFVIGMLFFGESMSIMRIAAALLIVGGLVLMKLATPS